MLYGIFTFISYNNLIPNLRRLFEMNKLKLLYDVIKTMKGKDLYEGTATIEVHKDETKIFYVKNEFHKNLVNNKTQANIVTEYDYEGKVVKHQSNTELTNHCLGHGFIKRRHHHDQESHCCGWKATLTKIGFVLNLLHTMQVEEKDNKSLITLNLNQIPEDVKMMIHQKMSHGDCEGHALAKEFCCIESGNLFFQVVINQNNEMEKGEIHFIGTQRTVEGIQHEMKLKAQVQLG